MRALFAFVLGGFTAFASLSASAADPAPAAQVVEIEITIAEWKSDDPADAVRDWKGAKILTAEELKTLQRSKSLVSAQRIQLTAVSGHEATGQFGEQRAVVSSVGVTSRGQQQRNINYQSTGTLVKTLSSVEGERITVKVDVERSWLGAEDEGVVIGENTDGKPVRAPTPLQLQAHTTLAINSGETIVVSAQGVARNDNPQSGHVILLTAKIAK